MTTAPRERIGLAIGGLFDKRARRNALMPPAAGSAMCVPVAASSLGGG
jgi:hypothetical protein